MITAALQGKLNEVAYREHGVFGVQIPQTCPNVPTEILNPKDTWENKGEYDKKAEKVAQQFMKNFDKYSELATKEILSGAPKV